MTSDSTIYVVSWNGDPAENIAALQAMYPRRKIVAVAKKSLTANNVAGRIRVLRQLRGEALVFFSRSLDDLTSPLLLASLGLFHRCTATVLLDSAGNKRQYGRFYWLRLTPALGLVLDLVTLLRSFVLLKVGLRRSSP
ncbi:MAG TPA: hypothetical protein VJ723_15460, partial [Candidatus Angelobacter sp.]|nr:hypothetical protein [Candidatus Angelobacter sp.]